MLWNIMKPSVRGCPWTIGDQHISHRYTSKYGFLTQSSHTL